MRILVTGSRHWLDKNTLRHALFTTWRDNGKPVDVVLVHGDCPTGADAYAARVAKAFGWEVEAHPANWAEHGKGAGPIRNQEMVDLSADTCLAFPLPDSRGTVDCMKRARKAKIPVVVHQESR